MQLIQRIKRILREYICDVVKAEVQQEASKIMALIPQLIEFTNSSPEEKQSYHDRSRAPLANYNYFLDLREQLSKSGVVVEDISINILDFEKWLEEYPEVDSYYKNAGNVYIEKCLEHYLSYRYLDMSSDDICIDVAAAGSPYADILRKHLKIKSYRLDMSYPEGIHGYNIGADAGSTTLTSGFASTLALHCAYECFMGNADIRFVREASRLLRPNGRYLITPLYLDATYFNATSPYCDQKEVIIDPEAHKIWRDDEYKVPFSRHYSPQAFSTRIYSNIPNDMDGKVYFVRNLPDVMHRFQNQRVYCYFMFYCEKRHRT
ncbi:MAG: hypothetical protein OEV42_17370 [Deltaproteobacteria bacterium]|nr:hypothetical protein [Deltaproteobacteria bacterium]